MFNGIKPSLPFPRFHGEISVKDKRLGLLFKARIQASQRLDWLRLPLHNWLLGVVCDSWSGR